MNYCKGVYLGVSQNDKPEHLQLRSFVKISQTPHNNIFHHYKFDRFGQQKIRLNRPRLTVPVTKIENSSIWRIQGQKLGVSQWSKEESFNDSKLRKSLIATHMHDNFENSKKLKQKRTILTPQINARKSKLAMSLNPRRIQANLQSQGSHSNSLNSNLNLYKIQRTKFDLDFQDISSWDYTPDQK
ncbi:unnamed protein product [Blepharisma stoltei]|uniref:Uncharacterized protein n=1 Tax=Blepharisma stoltei TaxID=1481888 RepID=A0AAU9IT93_9CILI|nr:unnamed protein product [Blepharisma stoltei]